MGFMVSVEGPEGSGKSSLIFPLAQCLRERGFEVITTREPGGCAIADSIRAILLDSANTALTAKTELLLYAAGRAQHVAEVIRPALSRGAIVLCDRYIDSTMAYQGVARGLDEALIAQLNEIAAGQTLPDLTLLLDGPPEFLLARALERNLGMELDEGRFEAESMNFHRRVRQGFLQIAANNDRFEIIDARQSQEDVLDAALSITLSRLDGAGILSKEC